MTSIYNLHIVNAMKKKFDSASQKQVPKTQPEKICVIHDHIKAAGNSKTSLQIRYKRLRKALELTGEVNDAFVKDLLKTNFTGKTHAYEFDQQGWDKLTEKELGGYCRPDDDFLRHARRSFNDSMKEAEGKLEEMQKLIQTPLSEPVEKYEIFDRLTATGQLRGTLLSADTALQHIFFFSFADGAEPSANVKKPQP